MPKGIDGEDMGLPGVAKYSELTVREVGDIAESLGITLLALLRG